MSVTRPPVVRTIVRGLRIRCPACGVGHVFERGIESAPACSECGWRLDRCPGHWVGGNEINLLVAFAAGVAVYVLSALAFGLGTTAVWLATAATGVSSLAFYRASRGVFFAIDYLIDPTADGRRPTPRLRRPPTSIAAPALARLRPPLRADPAAPRVRRVPRRRLRPPARATARPNPSSRRPPRPTLLRPRCPRSSVG